MMGGDSRGSGPDNGKTKEIRRPVSGNVAPSLPVLTIRDRLVSVVTADRRAILSAPPGTGKSTQVPQFFLDAQARSSLGGQILVLQPRRIAARNLALRVASERQEPVGKSIGYQVRFDSQVGPDTAVIYQTYGIAFQQMQRQPKLEGVSLIVLDEFHERTLETDAVLAWLRHLQAHHRPDLHLLIMSATLEAAALASYLAPISTLDVPVRHYPVTVAHQAPARQEAVSLQALRAFKGLAAQGLDGSVLVFMPGVGEIARTTDALGAYCRPLQIPVLELHGSMDVTAQQRVLAAPGDQTCVIVATNVAETSLTIAGVTAVIDSGLARTPSYDPDKELNTLHLGMISLHSAEQRAGRAGRTAPGRCVRLWGQGAERSMATAIAPEVRRLDLTDVRLALHALYDRAPSPSESFDTAVTWLTPPDPQRWQQAASRLEALGAIEQDRVTPLGRQLLRYPVHPALAKVLVTSQEAGVGAITAAMVAVLESDRRARKGDDADLVLLGWDLMRLAKGRDWDRDTKEAYRQLLRLSGQKGEFDVPADPDALRPAVTRCWLAAFPERLAARIEGTNSYALADGRKGTLDARAAERSGVAVLAMERHETGGANQARQVSIPLYLPVAPAEIAAVWPQECQWQPVSGWDAARRRVVQEEQLQWRGLVLDRRPSPGKIDLQAAEYLLVDKLMSGEVTLASLTDEVQQWVHRARLAAEHLPEMGFPRFDEDDWRLIYHDLCAGKTAIADVEARSLTQALRNYVGPMLADYLDRLAPRQLKLPSGRIAKYTYFEDAPPELSARLGDFLGMVGPHFIAEGRVAVTYDILAPNYRTVQKTRDLTSFWANTYPEVKKELQRRYPKHPWP
jgi:ATP-dependent helicase HrpB